MFDVISYVLSRKYVKETLKGLGALKGAPCKIKNVVHQDGVNTITFEWEGNDGTKRETTISVYDGTPIYVWESGDTYHYGDLVIYESAFYRCIVENSDVDFDDTKWNEIGSPDGNYDIVATKDLLPARFTSADRKMYYVLDELIFYLWDGYDWVAQNNVVQYTTMPTANAKFLDRVVQYVGATNNDFINCYFYKCVSDGATPAVYSWEKCQIDNDVEVWKVMGETGAKNILEYPYPKTSGGYGGMSLSANEDGSITVNGTSSAYSHMSVVRGTSEVVINKIFKTPGKYISSLYSKTGVSGNSGIGILVRVSDPSTSPMTTITEAQTIIRNGAKYSEAALNITQDIIDRINNGTYTYDVRIFTEANASFDNEVVYPMIRRAEDVDNTWQPYAPTNKELNAKIDDLPIRKGTGTDSIVINDVSGNVSSGIRAFSEGDATKAYGNFSHAEGAYTTAYGHRSHAQGYGTFAQGVCQTVLGSFNVKNGDSAAVRPTDQAVIIGNGTDAQHLSNALAIQWDGTVIFQDGSKLNSSPYKVVTDGDCNSLLNGYYRYMVDGSSVSNCPNNIDAFIVIAMGLYDDAITGQSAVNANTGEVFYRHTPDSGTTWGEWQLVGDLSSELTDIWKVMGETGSKNLLWYPYSQANFSSDGDTYTQAGITYTSLGDGRIEIVGTLDSTIRYSSCELKNRGTPYFTFEAGEYIVSDGLPATAPVSIIVRLYDSVAEEFTKTLATTGPNARSVHFTVTEEEASRIGYNLFVNVRLYLTGLNKVISEAIIAYPMIRRAEDMDDTWQPYVLTNKELMDKVNSAESVIRTLGTAAQKNSTDRVSPNNTGLVESQSVYSAINTALSSIYTPSGEITCAELTSSLLISENVGNVYELSDAGTTTALFLQGAGTPLAIGDSVGIINAGQGRILFNLMANRIDLSTFQKKVLASAVESATTVEGALSALSSNKVAKETGKGLSTNDYTDADKQKVTNAIQKSQTAGLVKNDGTVDTTAYAKQSEMSVTDGTGADADKTTIQLKSGTSATVLKTHQDISGKADKVSNATNGDFAALDANGNLVDSGKKASDFANASHTHTKSQISDFPSLATVATSGSYNDLSDKPTIPGATSIEWTGTASANSVRYQRIGIGGSYTEIAGTKYMEQTLNTSTSSPVDFIFSNAAILATSDIDVKASVFGMTPSNIVTVAGQCVVTIPAQSTAFSLTIRIYIR